MNVRVLLTSLFCAALNYGVASNIVEVKSTPPTVVKDYKVQNKLNKQLLNKLADNAPFNVVHSEKLADGNIKETVIEDGIVFQYIRKDNAPRPTWKTLLKTRANRPQKLSNAADTAYSESFEGSPTYNQQWLPNGWESFSKVGNIYKPEVGTTKIWRLSDGAISGTTDGQYLMWVNQEMEHTPDAKHDEWLVSSKFTPNAHSLLDFDFYYCPLFMVDNFNDKNFGSTFKIHASTDNGETWEEVWDISDIVKEMSYTEMATGQGIYIMPVWHNYRVDISKYAGKEIKLAFQVVGVSQSVGLDDVIVRNPHPEAAYIIPNGMFRWGYGEDLTFFTNGSFALAAPYTESQWINASNDECATYTWEFDNPEDIPGNSSIFFEEEAPTIAYPPSQRPFPYLTAANSIPEFTSTYTATETVGFIQYGGQPTYDGIQLGAGSFDVSKGYGVGLIDSNSYYKFLFGKGSQDIWQKYKLKAIANKFEKPAHPYTIKNVWVKAVNVVCTPDAELELAICKINEHGEPLTANPIATSICKGSDIQIIGEQPPFTFYNIPFSLSIYDEETGLISEEPIEINDPIMVIIRGFDSEEFESIGFSYQAEDHDGYENHAYVYIKPRNQQEEFYSLPDLFGTLYTSFLISLDIDIPYLHLNTEETALMFGPDGGTKDLEFTGTPSFYEWMISDCPEWLNIYEEYNDETNHIVRFETQPLPEGESSRSCSVTFKALGTTSTTINITQGDDASVSNVTDSHLTVQRDGQHTTFLNTENYDKIEIFNTTGVSVFQDNLSSSANSYTVKNDLFGHGLYIIRFSGKNTTTTKLIF